MSLYMAEGWNEMNFKVPSKPNHFMILCRQGEDAGEERGKWSRSLPSQGRKSTGLSQSWAPGDAQKHTVVLQTLPLQVPSPNCACNFMCPLSLSHCHSPRHHLPSGTSFLRGWRISRMLPQHIVHIALSMGSAQIWRIWVLHHCPHVLRMPLIICPYLKKHNGAHYSDWGL